MTSPPLFHCADVATLRAPTHPASRAADLASGDAGHGDVGGLAADPLVREAILVSSPTLAHRLDTVLDAAPDGPAVGRADLRRTVRALTSYRLRMATRSTPFGLMAGVTTIRFVEDPADAKVRLGSGHVRFARPDLEWLTEVIRACEQRPEVLSGLRVVLNNLCFPRGDRLVLPYVPSTARARRDRTAVQEVSVRHTAAVRAVAGLAATPIRFAELAARVTEAFPAVPADRVDAVLRQLVAKEILLTELRPSMATSHPLDHVLTVLADAPTTVPRELRAVRDALDHYAAQPLGGGRPALTAVHERMRGLAPGDRLVQVDLALDADVALPRVVAEEAERVADLLWRLSPTRPATTSLRQYHNDFLERYGQGRLVGLRELLDPDVGLGAPAGYRMPPTPRFRRPEQEDDTDRDRVLAELAQEAVLAGEREVVLTDDHALLARFASDEGRHPASLELHTHLLADSVGGLRDGDFRLVVIGALGQAAASFGRFAHLFDDDTRAAFGAVATAGVTTDPAAAVAQLTYQVRSPRGGNVSQVPPWAPHVLPVSTFAELGDPAVLRLDDLAVGGDAHGMFVIDNATGREVAPTTFHLLNAHNESPNAARFLREVGSVGVRRWMPWDWGAAAVLPYTPRVRHGRGVLALARWRPTDALCDQEAPFDDWLRAVDRWRQRWRVPDRICLSYADQRIDLDFDHPAHLRLLRRELGRRRESIVLTEVPADAGPGTGWLTGPDGAHRNEVVFPLLAPQATRTRPRVTVRPRPATGRHLPGGEWLHASVYSSAERHDELLRSVPALAAGSPVDRWFFLRYGDPDHHLRLRFHGTPDALAAQVLPRLSSWAAALRDAGMVRRLVLDTYDPEVERYGGPEAIEAAERVFHADSVAAVTQLRLLASDDLALDPTLLASANFVDLATRFWSGVAPGADWVATDVPRNAEHREFQRRRREATTLINPYDGWTALRAAPGGDAVLAAWEERATAVTRYGDLLRELGDRVSLPPTSVLTSLLHMHHNRLVGMDRDAELRAYALARGAITAHRERPRAGA